MNSISKLVGDTFPVGCAFDESNIHHKVHKNILLSAVSLKKNITKQLNII